MFSEPTIRPRLYDEIAASSEKYVHIILIGTKPDIIKQAPLYRKLLSRGKLTMLIHTGQHYDYVLSQGVLDEFMMNVDINLNIGGSIHEKYAQTVERLGAILKRLQEEYHKIPVPYVHGDTLTASTADKAAFLHQCAVVHVEAGLRTLTPKASWYHSLFTSYEQGVFDWNTYRKDIMTRALYERGSLEPFPEQFDTRSIEGSTGFFAAPTQLNADLLIDEGHDPSRIVVTGNTISDAVDVSLRKIPISRAFELYPNMLWKKYIFMTIHRRENCQNPERFKAIFYMIKKLLQDGVPVCFLALYASELAIDNYGLRWELHDMQRDFPDLLAYWPALAHHHEVVDMVSKSGAVVTDSGSMPEEANVLGIPCVSLRFWSDRPEGLLAGSTVLAPPVNSRLMAEIVHKTLSDDSMRSVKNLYWKHVSDKIIDGVDTVLEDFGRLFLWDQDRLKLGSFIDYKV